METGDEKTIQKRVYKDRPLTGISLNEFEKPGQDYATNLRRFCISIGVISPGESRIAVVKILDILLRAKNKEPDGLDSRQLIKDLHQANVKIVYANILRDLRKLIAIGLVEKRGNRYRIKENLPLKDLLSSFVKPYIIDRILNRVEDYADSIDKNIS